MAIDVEYLAEGEGIVTRDEHTWQGSHMEKMRSTIKITSS